MIEIDPTSDDILTLTQASHASPPGRNGARPHISTLVRWIVEGCATRDGRRVRLSAIRWGGKWLTSRAAMREFAEKLTPPQEPDLSAPRAASKRRLAEERTANVLAADGI
jgi:hypothetical protein